MEYRFLSEVEGTILAEAMPNTEKYDQMKKFDMVFCREGVSIPQIVLAEFVKQMEKDGLLYAKLENSETGELSIFLGSITLKGMIRLEELCRWDNFLEDFENMKN